MKVKTMPKSHPENVQIKKKYEGFLRRADGKSEKTIAASLAAIDRFFEMNNHKSLKHFRLEQAESFRQRFEDDSNPKTGKPYSSSTVVSTLKALQHFFAWLADQPGYGKIKSMHARYFTPSLADERIARAKRPKNIPTLEQINRVLKAMPANTSIQRRDRALIAFTALTGMRDAATATVKLRHIDLNKRLVRQDGASMNTKFNKTFTTFFFPVGAPIRTTFENWVHELQQDQHFGPSDPAFPKPQMGRDPDSGFRIEGLSRDHYAGATRFRAIFKDAFEAVGFPYANPHCLRDMLALLGLERCKDNLPALKAWSQNLGHSDMMTTLCSYASLTEAEQGRLLSELEIVKRPNEHNILQEIRKLVENTSIPLDAKG